MKENGFYRLIGRDFEDQVDNWYHHLAEVEDFLFSLGIEVAQEEIFIQWNHFAKKENYFLGCPVIGSKNNQMTMPFRQFDFLCDTNQFKNLLSQDWTRIFSEVEGLLSEKKSDNKVTLRLRRIFSERLELKIEAYLN